MPFFEPSLHFVLTPAILTPTSLASLSGVVLKKVQSIVAGAPSFSVRTIAIQATTKSNIIAIAASTGGTDALPTVLRTLPKNMPPILIVQHMPSIFTAQFADRLNRACDITVKEAKNDEMVFKGHAYIAPGDLHMRLIVRQQKLFLECFGGEKVNGVRPSADVLFESCMHVLGKSATGVILTGMGSDGAKGLAEMRKKGSITYGQNRETSTVYGMPAAAYNLGAVTHRLPLLEIASALAKMAEN
jgi:two-component system chemotaxis response regulator CheB